MKYIDKVRGVGWDEEDTVIREWSLDQGKEQIYLRVVVGERQVIVLSIRLDTGQLVLWPRIPKELGLVLDENSLLQAHREPLTQDV